MNALLSDTNIYNVLLNNLSNTLITELHTMLARWKSKKCISKLTYFQLNVTDDVRYLGLTVYQRFTSRATLSD